MKKVVQTNNAPAAVGPYSQAIKAGNFLFISGQLGVDMASGEISFGCVETQTRHVLQNLQTIAEAAGTNLAQALKITVYLTNMDDFAKMNSIYEEFFPVEPPARVCVEVSRLPKDVQVEMDAICWID